MTGAVIISHGDLSGAFLKALNQIAGEQPHMIAVSNAGRDLRHMETDIAEAIDRLSECDDIILFTDLQGGSCSLMCRRLLQGHENLFLMTGLNLPMLIEFVFYRGRPVRELLPILEGKGREGIRSYRGDGR